MRWLAETRGVKFELIRHFAIQMLNGEWSSAPGGWQAVVVGAFALLAPVGLLSLREGTLDSGKYRGLAALPSPEPFRAAALADHFALLTMLMAVTGLLALIQWQSFLPGRRDYLSLAGLPVRPRQVFVARFVTVLLFSTALVVTLNLLPSIVAPLEFGGRWQKNPSLAVNVCAQAVSSGLGCFFVLFAIAGLQGVLLNTLPARHFSRVSGYVQGGLIAVLLLAGLYSWRIRDWPQETAARIPEFSWAPPVWFAGLHERLLGDSGPFAREMAGRAVLAVIAAAVLLVVAYVISYGRYRSLLLEAPVQGEPPRKRQWSLLRLLSRDPRQQAVIEFMAKTLARSRAHRTIWLAWIGVAVAIVVNSSLVNGAFLAGKWHKELEFLVLFWLIGATVVLLSGFRHVLSIPTELPANWIFRAAESHGRKAWMSAVERFVILYTLAPIYLLIFPIAARVLVWPLAIRMTLLQLLASLTIFELLFYDWRRLPFTSSYNPGKRPLIGILTGYLAALGIGVPVLSLVIRAGSEFSELFPFYFAFFGAIWIWRRRLRRDGWGEDPLSYEDLPNDIPDLGIRELSHRGTGMPAGQA